MIGINLLPGTGQKARRSSGGGLPKLDIAASIASLRDRIRDPWMLGAVGVTLVAVAAVGVLYTTQTRREAALQEAEQKAVQDSTRYASVLRERERAEARRDTVLRSLNLIRAIDDDRFIWPHVMDEVSRALPPYTWIVSIGFTAAGQAQQAVSTLPTAPAAGGKKHHVQTAVPRDSVRIRIVGNTVDIQALTRFMKQLESSPFLEDVQLAKSERASDNGKEVTQFQLDMMYSRPEAELVRRVPLAVSVR
jgi:Tfp pilus assembly protein PilN